MPARLGGPTVGEDYRYTIDVDGTPVGDVFIAIRSGGVADRALYEAKSEGRNRVVVVDTAAPQPA